MAHLDLRLQLRHQRSPLRPSPQLLVASLSQALRARTQDLAVLTHQACLARRLVSPFHLRQVHQRVYLASPSRHLPVSVDVAPLLQAVLEAALVASPALVAAEAVLVAVLEGPPQAEAPPRAAARGSAPRRCRRRSSAAAAAAASSPSLPLRAGVQEDEAVAAVAGAPSPAA